MHIFFFNASIDILCFIFQIYDQMNLYEESEKDRFRTLYIISRVPKFE